ncbi:MAG: glycosyltransferase family 4 protein [Acidobacteria bacterium]|jgi:glycosyltransferase involved in cell wall biosynthesis|nr:glycosyltransferase family 4 protein [Acidobacteriota bacterium]
MNIAIDLTQIPADKTGIGIYAVNLVREMCILNNGKFHFFFFIQDNDHDLIQLLNEVDNREMNTIIPINSTVFRKIVPRIFFEQILLPHRCKKLGVNLIFSSHYTIPYFTRIKRVVAFHDMTFYLFPKMHQGIKKLYFKTLIPPSTRKSSAIITVSEATKKDILDRFKGLNPVKLVVIHHGVNETAPGKINNLEHAWERISDKYRLNEREYFLFVGTLEPRKNITGIIKAFQHVIQVEESYKKYKLVIAGKKGWFYNEIFETVKKLQLEEKVTFTGYVSEETKQALLINAFLFIYPSFYEGFGIPILEAMVHGVPVITGNMSALPEVAGSAALLVNPHHWQEISTALLRLLTDQVLYEKLSQKGRERAAKFSWSETAGKTMELFEKFTIHTGK